MGWVVAKYIDWFEWCHLKLGWLKCYTWWREAHNSLDNSIRVLQLSGEMCCLEYRGILYNNFAQGMWENYHKCKERQNWALAQRMCQQRVRNCLKSLRERVYCHDGRTLGIELYLQICSDYSGIFLSTTCDLCNKLVLASKVTFFFNERYLGTMWNQLLKLHSLPKNVVWTYICLCHFIVLLYCSRINIHICRYLCIWRGATRVRVSFPWSMEWWGWSVHPIFPRSFDAPILWINCQW